MPNLSNGNSVINPDTSTENEKDIWSQHLQRRIMRLLLQHDTALFRSQFKRFFTQSSLPTLPLFEQYDRYIKLATLSNDLLDNILPRIRRQLSLHTNHTTSIEDISARGIIDWPKTLERSWHYSPGQPPQQFVTRRRQHNLATPENILTVAILLAFQSTLQQTFQTLFADEALTRHETHFLSSANQRTERELSAAYARILSAQAGSAHIPTLIQKVTTHLKPGPSPYRELLIWWSNFQSLVIGRDTRPAALTLASIRTDPKVDAWLYELWIALEFIHLFHEHHALQTEDITVATDQLQCLFNWQGALFRFTYNRQPELLAGDTPGWQNGPASRPDYMISRVDGLQIRYRQELIWQEPPVIFDAKYYLTGSDPTRTHGPIKKMLGDMTLSGIQFGALLFPLLPEPSAPDEHISRTIQHHEQRYTSCSSLLPSIHLYHLYPSMPFPTLQQRLLALLNTAIENLPQRPQPACHAQQLAPDQPTLSHNPTPLLPTTTIICPKPHIGPGIFDLVNIHTDCLKNPKICHIMK